MNWTYKGKEFTAEDVKDEYVGFLYVISNIETGQKYCGFKYFWSTRTLPPLKNRKRRRKVKKQSDWQKYWSSSDELKESVKENVDKFEREIIGIYTNKSALRYAELEYQVKNNVLTAKLPNGEYEYINANIALRYYRSNVGEEFLVSD